MEERVNKLQFFYLNQIKRICRRQIMISVFSWVESIVGKGENAGNQYFLLFLQ